MAGAVQDAARFDIGKCLFAPVFGPVGHIQLSVAVAQVEHIQLQLGALAGKLHAAAGVADSRAQFRHRDGQAGLRINDGLDRVRIPCLLVEGLKLDEVQLTPGRASHAGNARMFGRRTVFPVVLDDDAGLGPFLRLDIQLFRLNRGGLAQAAGDHQRRVLRVAPWDADMMPLRGACRDKAGQRFGYKIIGSAAFEARFRDLPGKHQLFRILDHKGLWRSA